MFLLLLILGPLNSFAAVSTPEECLKVQNALDRRYCLDKHIESTNVAYKLQEEAWSKGVTQEVKDENSATLNTIIAMKKDQINLLNTEIAMAERHLESLKTANIVAATAAAPAPAKKKKKKSGLRIKW